MTGTGWVSPVRNGAAVRSRSNRRGRAERAGRRRSPIRRRALKTWSTRRARRSRGTPAADRSRPPGIVTLGRRRRRRRRRRAARAARARTARTAHVRAVHGRPVVGPAAGSARRCSRRAGCRRWRWARRRDGRHAAADEQHAEMAPVRRTRRRPVDLGSIVGISTDGGVAGGAGVCAGTSGWKAWSMFDSFHRVGCAA